MMARARWRQAQFALGLALLVALAGCSSSGGPHEVEVAPGYTVQVDEPEAPGNGRVAGIVGDDALYPLEGASIYLMGTELSTTSDSAGRFALLDVPPGIYIVEARLKDHAASQTTADVQPGQTARAVLLLPRIPPTDPYHVTLEHENFVEFAGGGAAFGGNRTAFVFTLDPSAPKTVVLESRWEGTFIATGQQEPLTYRLTDPGQREVQAGAVPNPFVVHVDARILTPGHDTFTLRVEPNWIEPIVFQGHGRTYVTVFYNEPAPAAWSFLAGST